jgi:YidC/Oxa1 family membrane protein insertase
MSIPLLDDAVGVAYPIAVTIAGLGGAALAIVVCTVALRTLLLPLTLASIRGERARASVAPGVQELTALYREAGVSPYAGLFPAFLQAPFFLVIYRLFVSPTIGGQANALLHNTFLGVGLSAHLVAAPLVFLPFLVILAILGWLTVRRNGIRGLAAALPFGTVVAAAFVPLAAVLYLVASTAWTGTVEVWLRRRALA